MNKNNFFWGVDFYPTPTDVIDRMLMDVDCADKVVLEPSAGAGAIVDELKKRGARVIACEIDPRFRKVLSGKCQVIGDDFMELTAERVSHVDYIIMNPPFSAVEKHIIHAYEIAPEGCNIVALCPTNMLLSAYSESRKQIRELIARCGLSDEFGECFKYADRSTDCAISCVRLWKPRTGDNEFADCFSLTPDEEQRGAGLAQYNVVRDIVNRYVGAVQMFDQAIASANAINELTKPIAENHIKFGAWEGDRNGKRGDEITRDYFKRELQKSAWLHIFNKMNMDKYVTTKVREDINRFVERQQHVPFTMRNVFRMLEVLIGTNAQRMEKVLIEAFDKICSFSADNSTAGEKWKTNSNYMVTRRFIVPYMCQYDTRWPTNYVDLSWSRNREEVDDIVKALCFLTGTNYDTIGLINQRFYKRDVAWGEWTEWAFFKVRGYKKGTMHFEFLDEDVWYKFNAAVAKAKGWELPQNTRKRNGKNRT